MVPMGFYEQTALFLFESAPELSLWFHPQPTNPRIH
jgi:hypothetical protein